MHASRRPRLRSVPPFGLLRVSPFRLKVAVFMLPLLLPVGQNLSQRPAGADGGPPPEATHPGATPSEAAPPEAAPSEAAQPADAEGWLRRLEALAQERGGLDARLRYTTVQGLLADEQVRFGRLRQETGGVADDGAPRPARFRIDLDGEVVDGTLRPLDRTLTWDGEVLLDADGARKEAKLRRLDGEQELTRTLPIPLRVDADALLARYEVELVDADPVLDPPGPSVHLRLRPKRDAEAEPAEALDAWFSATSGLPLRGRSGRPGGDTQSVDLVDPAPVDAFAPGLFATDPPAAAGWRVERPGG